MLVAMDDDIGRQAYLFAMSGYSVREIAELLYHPSSNGTVRRPVLVQVACK